VASAVASIKRLRGIPAIDNLLASWMDPVAGSASYNMMDEALSYLQRIHTAIRNIAADAEVADPMDLCARMVKKLGLPDIAVNPLIARSFVSHLQIIDREKLL